MRQRPEGGFGDTLTLRGMGMDRPGDVLSRAPISIVRLKAADNSAIPTDPLNAERQVIVRPGDKRTNPSSCSSDGSGVVGEFAGGGWPVELASLSDAALVPSTVAGILNLPINNQVNSPAQIPGVARPVPRPE
jgi:hypothetical protein